LAISAASSEVPVVVSPPVFGFTVAHPVRAIVIATRTPSKGIDFRPSDLAVHKLLSVFSIVFSQGRLKTALEPLPGSADGAKSATFIEKVTKGWSLGIGFRYYRQVPQAFFAGPDL
jgi:hypothetical protein